MTPLQIQHDHRIPPRQHIHIRPINRRIEASLRRSIIRDGALDSARRGIHDRDIRVPGIDDVGAVEARGVGTPAVGALEGDGDVCFFGDVEVCGDGEDGGAEGGVGEHGAGIRAEEVEAEV